MKHKSPIELLINIVSEVIEISKNSRLTTKELKQILFEADYPPQEAIELIEWFQNFANFPENINKSHANKTQTIRLFSKEEIRKISYQNLNKLNEMHIINIISSYERELIIKQAMEIKAEQITNEYFNWICKMVVVNQQKSNNSENKDLLAFVLNRNSNDIISH